MGQGGQKKWRAQQGSNLRPLAPEKCKQILPCGFLSLDVFYITLIVFICQCFFVLPVYREFI